MGKDIAKLCPGIDFGAGRVQECLRKKRKEIENKECKQMVKQVKEAESDDATLNPRIRGRCQNEMRGFCSKVERGQGRTLVCLGLHQKEAGFSEACRAAIENVATNATK